MTNLQTSEPTVALQGTEEWLSTLDDPHDATKSDWHELPEDEGLLEQDDRGRA